jgi:hypothetical protein
MFHFGGMSLFPYTAFDLQKALPLNFQETIHGQETS